MSGPSAAQRFVELFDDHHGSVSRYVHRRVGRDAAQDVVAEVFLTAWRHLDRAPAAPLPWLYRIAGNAIANHGRAEQRRSRLITRIASCDYDAHSSLWQGGDPAPAVAEADRVAVALRQLSPRDREALRLIAWEDLSVADAAAAMGCSLAAMKVRLHRARRRLVRALDEPDIPTGAADIPTGAADHNHPSAVPVAEVTP